MKLFPAIDLFSGKVVRLSQGDYEASTEYGDNPAAVARSFVEAGAEWIHIVDLNAARGEGPVNRQVISSLAAEFRGAASIQAGGGVRSVEDVRQFHEAGVARAVMGSAAIRQPELVMLGPDIDGLSSAASATSIPVIASGGVSSLDDLRVLSKISGLAGVIAGKAIYEGRFSVAEAVEVLR
jgi:phosphoribosylformimino-5-aminoimidazole carboxamide ribonucleotide (ProFAR) isomerase